MSSASFFVLHWGRRPLGALGLVGLLLGLSGCPDPMGQFDDFSEKLAQKPKGPAGDCGPETVTEVEGTFFLSLATQLDLGLPVVMLAELSMTDEGLAMSWQPLAAADRQTPVGSPIAVPAAPIAEDGTATFIATDVIIAREADPLIDDEIEAATITLAATVCADFICGGFGGNIVRPAPITLLSDQSKFAMERIEDGEPYPEPPQINCLGDRATPVEDR